MLSFFKHVTVEPVLFLYMFAVFMQYSAFQDLVYEKVCISKYNISICENLYNISNSENLDVVQKESSFWILSSTVSLILPSMITVNFLGSWGDSFGRKVPLLMPSVGGVLSSVVYICMSFGDLSGPVWPVIIASAISGLFGGFVSCIMAVMSYIATISSHGSRTTRVSLLEAMTFLGGTIGPFVGGLMLSFAGHAAVFGFIILIHSLSLIYVSLFVQQITATEVQAVNNYWSMKHFKESLKTCFKERNGHKRHCIVCFLICCMVLMTTTADPSTKVLRDIFHVNPSNTTFTNHIQKKNSVKKLVHFLSCPSPLSEMQVSEMDIAYLYAKDKPLNWKYDMYSYFFGFKYALGSISLFIGTPLLKYFNVSDHSMCVFGIISKAAAFIVLGLSATTTMMFLVPITGMLSFFCIPALRSLLSKQVESDELGKMYAFLATVEDVSTLLGSLIFNSLYPVLRSIHRGLIFQFAAVLQVVPLIVIIWSSTWTESASYAILEDTN